jgi:hypothetical protein
MLVVYTHRKKDLRVEVGMCPLRVLCFVSLSWLWFSNLIENH